MLLLELRKLLLRGLRYTAKPNQDSHPGLMGSKVFIFFLYTASRVHIQRRFIETAESFNRCHRLRENHALPVACRHILGLLPAVLLLSKLVGVGALLALLKPVPVTPQTLAYSRCS